MTTPDNSGLSYATVYPGLIYHKKVNGMPDPVRLAALGFYCAALAFCQNMRTEGLLEAHLLANIVPCSEEERQRAIDALLATGLLDRAQGSDLMIHDYLDHNRSNEEIARGRRKMREGGRKGGLASGEARTALARAVASEHEHAAMPDQESKPTLQGSPEKSSEERSREEKYSVLPEETTTGLKCVRCDSDTSAFYDDGLCPDCHLVMA